ncbi:putative dsRNA-binding protein, partial [Bacillus sp. D-CC]
LVIDSYNPSHELIQRDGSGNIEYQILQEKGPAHNREFVSRVTLNNVALGLGSGKSKKEAEQQAAAEALKKLKEQL